MCDSHHRQLHDGRLLVDGSWSDGFRFRHADGSVYGTPALDAARADVLSAVFSALCHSGFRQGEARAALDAVRPRVTADTTLEEAARMAFIAASERARRGRACSVREAFAPYLRSPAPPRAHRLEVASSRAAWAPRAKGCRPPQRRRSLEAAQGGMLAAMGRSFFACVAAAALLLAACGDDSATPSDGGTMDGATDAGPNDPPAPAPFTAVPQTARHALPGLSNDAHVVRTEMDVPHIYAKNRLDAFRVMGFIMAQDRFFQMDMTRRLSEGRLSEALGQSTLATDIQSRETGGAFVADLYLQGLSDDEAAEVDAFAAGINAYIAEVRARDIAAPKEYMLAYLLFGLSSPADLMKDWTRRDVVATGSTILYQTSFDTSDVQREAAFDQAPSLFSGDPDRALRMQGLVDDIEHRYAPPKLSSSAAGWGIDTAGGTSSPLIYQNRHFLDHPPLHGPRVERGMLARLSRHLSELTSHYPRDPVEGFGSNSWAVAGTATADGSSILCGDGHLQLSVPSLFWQFGVDTELLGDASQATRTFGATVAGLPLMGVGTNGKVAWSQTNFFADVTDWYAEQVVLDASGMPRGTMYQGVEHPLTRVDEQYVVADIPAIGSMGRTVTIPRFKTFDGRWLTGIEGRTVTETEPLGPGESRVNMMGSWVVPGDQDGDGVVNGVSFYYGPFDGGTLLRAFREFGLANNVQDFRQAMRHFIGYGASLTASDSGGHIFHSGYHAVPCRNYLPRDPTTNAFVPGADPRRLIDGTQYGAWSIPLDPDGRVDETAATGDTHCAVPFDEWPQALDPARQYVHHANNDPGNITTDDDLWNDPYYIGGPWIAGYRASRIEQRLQHVIAAHDVSIDSMAKIQADHRSSVGEQYVPFLLEAIDMARTAAAGSPAAGTPEARMAASFTAHQAALEEVERRMITWRDAGYPTPSGVQTFYDTPAAGDADNAVATMIFASWFPRFVNDVIGDEGIPPLLSPSPDEDTYIMRTMKLLVDGRGPTNPNHLSSWDPTRKESVFFDDVRTPQVESSDEIGLRALTEALAFLSGAPTAPGEGGFGTADMSTWLWGLRHQVRFESLIGGYVGSDPNLTLLSQMFTIDTSRIPLADSVPAGDPRADLTWFPRPGDYFNIDAANPGFSGTSFTYGDGPVFRMVIKLGPGGVKGQNILPGGQSGDPSSPYFDDQVRLWLANQTIPIRYLPSEVAAGAVSRQRFVPAPPQATP